MSNIYDERKQLLADLLLKSTQDANENRISEAERALQVQQIYGQAKSYGISHNELLQMALSKEKS